MTAKFAIGQPVPRKEDPRLLTGGGRYTDDINLPNQAHGFVLRSPLAHGLVRSLETAPALAIADVIAVFTASDLAAAGIQPFPFTMPITSHDGSPPGVPKRWALARDRVNHIGEALALVVGESVAAARDGAERIGLDIEPLPVVSDPEAALAADAAQVHDDVPNLCLDWHYGDFEGVRDAFARAAHITKLRLVNNRIAVATSEPRGALADYDSASQRFTIRLGCQGVFAMRQALAGLMGIAPERLRVLSHDVGGSFGMKSAAYPEYPALLHAARALGRPVKWINDRSGSFVSDQQARDSVFTAELALDDDGNFLGLRIEGLANLGAYLTTFGPLMPTLSIQKNAPSLYRTQAMAIRTRCVFTNTLPIGPYRGAGRPEGNYIMERLVDAAAREMGIDRIEIRRQNLVSPAAMPFTAASGQVYDSGDFDPMFDMAMAASDWGGFAGRRAASEAAGLKRGLGICAYLEVSAPPGKEMGGLRFGEDGRVTIVSGTLDYGQGHRATFAQILSARLGIGFDKIDLLQGDSDELIVGGGTGGSRSVIAEAGALYETAAEVIKKGRAVAGHVLEAAVEDVEFADGTFRIAGTDRSIGLIELAARMRELSGADGLPETLDTELVHNTAPSSFPNGVHVCEVEIDPETGATTVDRYFVVDDFGTIVNPLLAEGQVHGGIVQGIGQALLEKVIYDGDGQLLTGSYMDYAMPRADHVPDIAFEDHPVPATTNVIGAKGAGEAGCSGALAAIMNAMVDALAEYGVTSIDMPATPHRVWQAINGANG
jgi:carbon-monoxide dehydrogenase large subunit